MTRSPMIHTSKNAIGEWEAIDDNTYDGQPESQMGVGNTKQEAIDNLKDQLYEDGLYSLAEMDWK